MYIAGLIFVIFYYFLIFLPLCIAVAVIVITQIIGCFVPKVRLTIKHVRNILLIASLGQIILMIGLDSGLARLNSHKYVQENTLELFSAKVEALARGGSYYHKSFSLPLYYHFDSPPYQEIFLRFSTASAPLSQFATLRLDNVRYSTDGGKTYKSSAGKDNNCSFTANFSIKAFPYVCEISILSGKSIEKTPESIIIRADVRAPIDGPAQALELRLKSSHTKHWTWTGSGVIRDTTNIKPEPSWNR